MVSLGGRVFRCQRGGGGREGGKGGQAKMSTKTLLLRSLTEKKPKEGGIKQGKQASERGICAILSILAKALSCRLEDYYNHPYALPTAISIALTSIYTLKNVPPHASFPLMNEFDAP